MPRFILVLLLAICFQGSWSQKLIARPMPIEPIGPPVYDGPITDEPITDEPITKPPVETTTAEPYVPTETVTIVGADTIFPNSFYRVIVSLFNADQPAVFRVGIRSRTGSEDFSANVTALPNQSVAVRIAILSNIVSTSFELYGVNIDGSLDFNMSKPVLLSQKRYQSFVETDKGTYKPGDLVQFRVVILDRFLKATRAKPLVQVYLNDNAGNRLKQWNNVTLRTGVFRSQYQLSSQPPLGQWSITVDDGFNFVTKNFVVDEYVLPKFQVNINGKRHIAVSDSTVSVTVNAKYTFGQYVKGKYNITAIRTWYITGTDAASTVERDNIDCSSENVESYNLVSDLGVTYDCDIIFKVSFEEDLTGKVQTGEYTISVHYINYQISITGNDQYNPGLTYKLYATVTNWDGEPIRDTVNQVSFTVQNQVFWRWRPWIWDGPSYSETPSYTETKNVALDSNGIARVEFTLPTGYDNFLITASYKDAPASTTVSKKSSSNDEYIQANVLTINPKIVQPMSPPVSVRVETTKAISLLTWQITAANNIILANTIAISPPSGDNTFTFRPTSAMVPSAKILVSYVSEENGNIISDVIDINFDVTLPNKITINASESETTPGANVTLTIKTTAASYVGIAGVDQKVLLLSNDNQLTSSDITGSISTYDAGNTYEVYDYAYSKYSDGRTVILTNAPSSQNSYPVYDYPILFNRGPQPMYMMAMADNAAPEMAPAPMAPAPMAPAPEQKSSSSSPTVVFRKFLPETWFYEDIRRFPDSGTQVLEKKVPDDITKWIITGFAVDYKVGFGLTAGPTELTAFYKFFIQLNLPYSIVRGESIAITMIVFNYQTFDVTATVTLDNSKDQFEFVGFGSLESLSKTISIPQGEGVTVSFLIQPTIVGSITIKVSAVTDNAGDGIEQLLLVKPEGVTQTVCNGYLVDLRNATSFNATNLINIPNNVVPDSTHVKISIAGDVLGSSLKNLDNLIQMPYGCGEQNMLNFVPNIIVLDYLTKTDKLTASQKAKILNYMEQGYQREITYKHSNGAYSAFGESNNANGSTWLTAFVIKSFREGQKSITIDEGIITQGFNFLVGTQQPDGSFVENGFVIHTDMKGGGSSELGLTCYVLLAFLSTPADQITYQSTIDNAFNYIINELDNGNDDVYSLALANYALQLAQHPDRDRFLTRLESKAITDGGYVYWENPSSTPPANSWWYQPDSFKVELTGYCALSLLKAGKLWQVKPIATWLISQQNENGGFQSTQDTVIGLTALGQYAAAISGGSLNQKVSVFYQNWRLTYTVTSSNAQILQQRELPSNTTKVTVRATGSGASIFQVCYSYNINEVAFFPRFTITATVLDDSTTNNLKLSVCFAYLPLNDTQTQSNMALAEISLPSGYTSNNDDLLLLPGSNHVQSTETKNGDTIIVIYFDYLDASETCIEVGGSLTSNVADQKPSSITVVDYYLSGNRGQIFYETKGLTQCGVCDGDECVALNCAEETVAPTPAETSDEVVPDEPDNADQFKSA